VQRAGVFIGVNQTGNLTKLHDAAANAGRMHAWALTQGMQDGTSAVLLTDEAGSVTPDLIADTIDTIIRDVAPEQLIVYFAGHGVLARSSEQWLLSKAPVRPTHAVDVRESAINAQLGMVPHVVVISDACRTAPEGIQAQNVVGGSIFPNVLSGRQCEVDIYYACAVGKPAAEIQNEADAVGSYRGVFTEVLLEALEGTYKEAFMRLPKVDKGWYAGVRRLKDVLNEEVPRRIRSKRLKARYTQNPWAEVVSDDDVWIARLDKLPRAKKASSPVKKKPPPPPPAPMAPDGGAVVVPRPPAAAKPPRVEALPRTRRNQMEREVEAAAATVAPDFGPPAFETECGVKVRGARIAEFLIPGMNAERAGPGESLRLYPRNEAATLLLRIDSGLVTVLPMIPGFIAALTFEDQELVSVAYEPSANSWRYPMYHNRAKEIRGLRARAAAASALGRFELSGEDGARLAAQMQYAKGVDPSLAVYAAYAYFARGNAQRIAEMSSYLRGDVGVTIFDLALLSGDLVDRGVKPSDPVLPCVPLLAQGWADLRAHRSKLPTPLRGVNRLVTNSLWSVYRPEAFDKFKTCLEKGLIR
jgi:hypothetical protein